MVKPDQSCSFGNELLQVTVGSDLGWNSYWLPAWNFGPDEEWDTAFKAFGDSNRSVRPYSRKRRPAICDRDFAAQVFDWAETIQMRRTGQCAQIERSGKLSIHHCFPLRANEMQIIPMAHDIDLLVGACRPDADTQAAGVANGATAQTQADFQNRASADHYRLHRWGCFAIADFGAQILHEREVGRHERKLKTAENLRKLPITAERSRGQG